MKIRSDFVTNSSSSSFVLSLKIDFKDGHAARWEGMSDCGEGAFPYFELSAAKSPKELGSCNSIDELVEMLKTSVGMGEDEDELQPVLTEKDEFIIQIRQHSSMDEIKSITIEGYEDTLRDYDDCGPYANDEIITYDLETKEQTAFLYGAGEFLECEGNGGQLLFKREVKHRETPENWFESKREMFSEYQEEDDFF